MLQAPGVNKWLCDLVATEGIWARLLSTNDVISLNIDTYRAADEESRTFVIKFLSSPPADQSVIFCFPTNDGGTRITAWVNSNPVDWLRSRAYANAPKLQEALNRAFQRCDAFSFAVLYGDHIYSITGAMPKLHHVYLYWAEEVRCVTENDTEVLHLGRTPILIVSNKFYQPKAFIPLWPKGREPIPITQVELAAPMLMEMLTLDRRPEPIARVRREDVNKSRLEIDQLIYSKTMTDSERQRFSERSSGSSVSQQGDDDDDYGLQAWLRGDGIPRSSSTSVSDYDDDEEEAVEEEDEIVLALEKGKEEEEEEVTPRHRRRRRQRKKNTVPHVQIIKK